MNGVDVFPATGMDTGLVCLCPVCYNVFLSLEMIQSSSYLFNAVCRCGTLIYLVLVILAYDQEHVVPVTYGIGIG